VFPIIPLLSDYWHKGKKTTFSILLYPKRINKYVVIDEQACSSSNTQFFEIKILSNKKMDGNKRKQLNQALLAPDEEEEEVRYRNVLFYSPTKFCSSNSSNNSDANLLESSASRDLPRH